MDLFGLCIWALADWVIKSILFLLLDFQIYGGSWSADEAFFRDKKTGKRRGYGWIVLYLAIGAGMGVASLAIAPHLILPSAWMRAINLVTAPIAVGWVGYWAAKGRTNRGDHFWMGFCFALAFSGVRLDYGQL